MKNKRIMVLGGGSSQINLIKECVRQGHFTILADINEKAPGRAFSSSFEKASTFDIEAVISAAEKNNIDAVMTAGTDQPVLTSAAAAEKLKLPQFLNKETAASVTNKRIMKKIFKKNNLKTASFEIINKDFTEKNLNNIKSPFVIKPLDSQGQRGVFKLNKITEIKNYFKETLSFSRENEILVEEYYDSDEITVSGWVNNGKIYFFTVTDRVTFENPPTIGVCASHIFPSPYIDAYHDEIIETTSSIVEHFHIKNGPIYFQYLIGNKGLLINEIACRLGGAYEDEFIPLVTGIDIRKLLIKGSLGEKISDSDFCSLKPFTLNSFGKYVSVPLLFCREGVISDFTLPDYNKISSLKNFSFLQKEGTLIKNLNNSTQRAGYAVLLSYNYTVLNSDIKYLFNSVSIKDSDNLNMIMKMDEHSFYRNTRRYC